MGIDIEAGGRVSKKQRVTKSANPYIRLLCKLYKFLARRTESKFNKVWDCLGSSSGGSLVGPARC